MYKNWKIENASHAYYHFIIVSVVPDAITTDAPLNTESSTASTGRSINNSRDTHNSLITQTAFNIDDAVKLTFV